VVLLVYFFWKEKVTAFAVDQYGVWKSKANLLATLCNCVFYQQT